MVVQKVVMFFPQAVKAVCCVSVPFQPPQSPPFKSIENIVKILPNFKYQVWLSRDNSHKLIENSVGIRKFLINVYNEALDVEDMSKEVSNRVIGEEELQYYVKLFTKTGFKGCNTWYKDALRRINYNDDCKFMGTKQRYFIDVPGLFIGGKLDKALPPIMWSTQRSLFITSFIQVGMDAGHWAFWEDRDKFNKIILDWISTVDDKKGPFQTSL